jgi:cell division septal protein FtsQ
MENFSLDNIENSEIEFIVWQYHHQLLAPIEQDEVALKITDSDIWKNALDKIIQEELQLQVLEEEQPSMRFTKNIMEAIQPLEIKKPIHNYVNKKIIRLAAAYFLFVIALTIVLLGIQIAQHWDSSKSLQINLSLINPTQISTMTHFISPQLVYCFYGINLVTGMILLQNYLIHRVKNKNASKI